MAATPASPTTINLRLLGVRYFLALDGDALPERDVVLDVGGSVFGLRIIPSGIVVALAIDHDVVVASGALPGAGALMAARLEELLVDGARWKVDISLDDLELIGLCNHLPLPNRLCHLASCFTQRRARGSGVESR